MRNFMGRGNFVWWTGVVEDRNDPVQMGRVKVRCFGYHTEDKNEIPIEDLPWALTINGIQSGSVSGMGYSPIGLVEGSWVIGFFLDGDRAQEPIVIGSLSGVPSTSSSPHIGFNDPNGEYPRWVNESDMNLAGRESLCETHPARIHKNSNRVNDSGQSIKFPCARPPKITSVAPDRAASYYTLYTWNELPAADNYTSVYPYNHVYETESGHLQEFDDTEGMERFHRYHPSGTYEEIIADGSKTIKVVGDSYELLLQNDNVYIKGNYNVTVGGTKRELIKGNYHLQVEGDVSYDFQKSWQTKVAHNQESEIGKTRAVNISDDDFKTLIKGDNIENIVEGEKILNVKRDYTLTVNEDYALTTFGNTQFFSTGDYKLTNLGNHYVTSKGDMTIQSPGNQSVAISGNMTSSISGSVNETVAGGQTTAVTGNLKFTAAKIDLN
jgi:hypothetical protein